MPTTLILDQNEYDKLRNIVAKRCGFPTNSADVEDLLQEILLSYMTTATGQNIYIYTYRKARPKRADMLDKNNRQMRRDERMRNSRAVQVESHEGPLELNDAIKCAIDRAGLTGEEFTTLHAHYYGGVSIADIARMMRVSRQTASTYRRNALDKVKRSYDRVTAHVSG